MFRLLLVLTVICCAFAGAPTETKVSASIENTQIDGLEGFNVNLALPFKIQDYIVGFKYALGDFKKAPESLFFKRTYNTPQDGTLTVDADYEIDSSVFGVDAKWSNKLWGFSVRGKGNSRDKFKSIEFEKDMEVKDNKLSLKGGYELAKKVFSGFASYDVDGLVMSVECDSGAKDPVVTLSKSLDDSNKISPSISLKTGATTYGYTRSWTGGSLESKFYPGDKVNVEWKDEGASGTWTTSADFPLDKSEKCKVSFSRDWSY